MSTITSTPPPLNPLDHAALRRVLAHHIADCTANLPRLSEALFGLEIIEALGVDVPAPGRVDDTAAAYRQLERGQFVGVYPVEGAYEKLMAECEALDYQAEDWNTLDLLMDQRTRALRVLRAVIHQVAPSVV